MNKNEQTPVQPAASPVRTCRSPLRLAAAAGLAALALAAAGFTTAELLPHSTPELAQPAETTPEARESIDFANMLSNAFKHAATQIEPSVVNITSFDVKTVQPTDRYGRRVGQPTETERRTGLGSGVIVDERGYLVTNNHVVKGSEKFVVRLYDGREVQADLIGADPSSDIAVLQIAAPGLQAASWGDAEAAQVGQWVIAVGSPFGLEQTVTAGIVSSTGRTPGEIHGNGPRGQTPGSNNAPQYQEFIQTDAAINPGNSGGPLVDLHGRIVGINTAIASRSGGNQGLGFAVPADLAHAVAQSIIESGRVRRGFMGISWDRDTDSINAQTAYELGIPGGVQLTTVTPGGPADDAGLAPGDIVIAINGRATENAIRLRNAISIAAPGDTASVEFYRDGERRQTDVVITDRFDAREVGAGGKVFSDLGIAVIPRELKIRRGREVVGTETGLQIVEIEPGSPADRSGLTSSDIILEVAGERIKTADELDAVLSQNPLRDGLEFKVFNGRMIGELFVKDE
ncbi:MAG: serine protease Do [Phycisphaerales bacterium]|jgi:serine protease Do